MDLFAADHSDLVLECLRQGLAGRRVALADDVVDVRLEFSQVLLGNGCRLLSVVDHQFGAAAAKTGELGVEVGDALTASLLGHVPFSKAVK
jgi:hypothetical protein